MVHNYKAGIGNVGSYQASAIPYASASIEVPPTTPKKLQFPRVSKFVKVTNTGTADVDIRVGWSLQGVQRDNYFLLSYGESYEGEFRCTAVFLMADGESSTEATVTAGLTNIAVSELEQNWSGSVGVG